MSTRNWTGTSCKFLRALCTHISPAYLSYLKIRGVSTSLWSLLEVVIFLTRSKACVCSKKARPQTSSSNCVLLWTTCTTRISCIAILSPKIFFVNKVQMAQSQSSSQILALRHTFNQTNLRLSPLVVPFTCHLSSLKIKLMTTRLTSGPLVWSPLFSSLALLHSQADLSKKFTHRSKMQNLATPRWRRFRTMQKNLSRHV